MKLSKFASSICQSALVLTFLLSADLGRAESDETIRIGMIGLDTSHAPAFAQLFNAPDAQGNLAKMRVVAAFPGGSDDIASSRDRVQEFTQQLSEMGIEIVDSVEKLVTMVDAILLESVDGRKHLEQVIPVFKAGLPVFIDKPLAGNLTDALAIDLLAKQHNARWFSSSSLRFSASIIRFRESADYSEGIRGATSWGPCSLEPTHTDLYWYGVHATEMLYTALGQGCQSVTRLDHGDILVVGHWEGNRTGTVRGIMDGKKDYGLVVFGQKEIVEGGKYEGYPPLVHRIADFFQGAPPPVSPEETLEMFTFMEAADVSLENGSTPVALADVRKVHLARAKAKLEAKLTNATRASETTGGDGR